MEAIADALVEILTPWLKRIEALETQVKNVRFRGTYQRAESYQKRNFVTHRGSLWSALCDGPADAHGENPTERQRAVKSGEAPR